VTINKTSSTAPVTVTPSVNSNKPLSSETKANAAPGKKASAGVSSQMQLLGLAKQFVLDGALLSPEKQMPIEDRARKRERLLHLRKQQNLEMIIQKTIGYCSDSEITDRADQDWFNSYLALAEDIGNRTMQDLWAKILAGEISQPGTFSLKALKVFRSLNINEAKLLAKACGLAVKDQGKKSMRILSGVYQKPGLFNMFDKHRENKINLAHWGLSYTELLVLADNDLIFIQETESSPVRKNDSVHFTYNGQQLTLTARKNDCILNFYKFTPIGAELASLIADNPDDDFLTDVKQQLNHHFATSG